MEAIALIADIHANLLAAEAVLSDIRRKHRPDRIISLGDQVNLGPAPSRHAPAASFRKRNLSARQSRGIHPVRHEQRIRDMPAQISLRCVSMPIAPQTGRNHLSKIADRYSGVTFCHALPEDDRFPVSRPGAGASPPATTKTIAPNTRHHLRPRPQPSCTTVCQT